MTRLMYKTSSKMIFIHNNRVFLTKYNDIKKSICLWYIDHPHESVFLVLFIIFACECTFSKA